MAKKIIVRGLIVIVAVLAIFAAVVAMQPDEYRVSRSLVMAAPPEAVFNQVNDFHNWNAWSPWAKVDPNCEYTYGGPLSGEGAKFSWNGNDEVGSGTMTIAESKPGELVRIDMHFLTPMDGLATTEFLLKPEGEKTLVTWNMRGENNFVGKAFCLFMNMDKMIGDMYDKGLANMQQIVEATPAETSAEPSGEKPAETETD